MNKKQFEAFFKSEIEPNIPKDDKPALRQAWNDTIDSYIKDGKLMKKAGDWAHPKRFYRPTVIKWEDTQNKL